MRRFFSKNKKGFTLVEVIVTVAIMTVVTGMAVGTGVAVSADRQQRITADASTQQMYRVLAICAIDLARRDVTPDRPWNDRLDGREAAAPGRNAIVDNHYGYYDESDRFVSMQSVEDEVPLNGHYSFYAKRLVEEVYKLPVPPDIPVRYSRGSGQTPETVPFARENPTTNFFPAGNKNPYMVVQCRRDPDGKPVLIISYHNDKKPFTPSDVAIPAKPDRAFFKSFTPYETNKRSGGLRDPIAYLMSVPRGKPLPPPPPEPPSE